MRICIDSCVFIRGLRDPSSDAGHLLAQIGPSLEVVVPRLIAIEVTRNLVATDIAQFYQLMYESSVAYIVEEAIPKQLLQRYIDLGLRAKGDAYIGAFAEWLRVDYLISDNRHFLQELRTDAYRLLTPADFLKILRSEPKP